MHGCYIRECLSNIAERSFSVNLNHMVCKKVFNEYFSRSFTRSNEDSIISSYIASETKSGDSHEFNFNSILQNIAEAVWLVKLTDSLTSNHEFDCLALE